MQFEQLICGKSFFFSLLPLSSHLFVAEVLQQPFYRVVDFAPGIECPGVEMEGGAGVEGVALRQGVFDVLPQFLIVFSLQEGAGVAAVGQPVA